MTLAAGARVGRYQIRSPLGAGGMGEVYRAHDTQLQRDVALKVLPPHLVLDEEARSRFEREARAVASLSHPNILAIHDFGVEHGVAYAAMELLEGDTLRLRLDEGPLAVQKAVELCAATAQGLAAAHEKGVVHRDLKPENIFVLRDGRVKILDFGLARLDVKHETPSSSRTELRVTDPGTVLGTVGYMSPEQAKGQPADHRSDIFSLGCVLFEALTGRQAFARETAAETMTAILREDPVWPDEGRLLPAAVEQVTRHCLEKRPEERFQSARDFAFALQALASSSSNHVPAAAASTTRTHKPWLAAGALVVAGVALGAGALALVGRRAPPVEPVVMTSVLAPPETVSAFHHGFALSPDARTIAFAARSNDGTDALWMRALADDRARRLEGTSGARYPFWSPDGRHIGFFAGRFVRRVPAAGGPVEIVCESSGAPFQRGAWPEDGLILVSGVMGMSAGVFRVPASGGTPVRLTPEGMAAAEVDVVSGGAYAFSVRTGPASTAVYVGFLDGGAPPAKVDGLDNLRVRFAPEAGVVLFRRGGATYAQRFDAVRRTLSGPPLVIAREVGSPMEWTAVSTRAETLAMLAHVTADSQGDPGDPLSRLQWFDRTGQPVGDLTRQTGRFWAVRVSPDGRTAAVNPDGDVWLYDATTGRRRRLTSTATDEWNAVWSPDGRRIVYRGDPQVLVTRADGESPPELLMSGDSQRLVVSDWSIDGRFLLVDTLAYQDPDATYDVYLYDMETKTSRPIVATPFDERLARFSPTGSWIAFMSNATGEWEVFVRRVAGGATVQVSSGGGGYPVWARSGRELFYLSLDDRIVSVDASALETTGAVGQPQPLFRVPINRIMPFSAQYDVSPEGRFLVNVLEAPEPLTLIQGWQSLVR